MWSIRVYGSENWTLLAGITKKSKYLRHGYIDDSQLDG